MYTITTEKIPIKVWAETLDEKTLAQAKNLANLPFATKWIAIMPDAHVGYGMPIGAVLATDGFVIPHAVGVDIGCGVSVRKTNINVTALNKDKLYQFLSQIQRDVPTGFRHHQKAQKITIDFSSVPALEKIFAQAAFQIGTLGSGNHFIELQKDDAGSLHLMLHSGSRGIGKQVCDYYNRLATPAPFPDLAYFSLESPLGRQYLTAMNLCLLFAQENRLAMTEKITQSLAEIFPDLKIEKSLDTHHNYAALEKHFGKTYLLHRKGAVKAEGEIIIPGSMGTKSYLCQGLSNPQSFSSCAHGAGRALSRSQALKTFPAQKVLREMEERGIALFKTKKSDVAEEWAEAYKDIDSIMENQKDLVKPEVSLTPIGVVKG